MRIIKKLTIFTKLSKKITLFTERVILCIALKGEKNEKKGKNRALEQGLGLLAFSAGK